MVLKGAVSMYKYSISIRLSLRKIRSDKKKASVRESDTLFALIIFFPVTATAEEGSHAHDRGIDEGPESEVQTMYRLSTK